MKRISECLIASFFCAAALCISSCSNFLSGGDFKEQLESDIEYAESDSYEIKVQCDDGAGSITSLALLSKKVTDEFAIEFTIAEGVQFSGWKAYSKNDDGTLTELSEDYIKFIDYNTTAKDGIYRATVRFTKAAKNIVIKPVCIILPHIDSIYPPFDAQGFDQDTMIKITFNKEMNPDTFGDFSCITIKSGTTNLSEYFGTPYFSNSNKVINIPTVRGKFILTKGSSETKDIKISIDTKELKDSDDLLLEDFEGYTYRINGKVDEEEPVLTSLTVKSTDDETSAYYKTLTDKAFGEWSDSADGSFAKGDYSRNHVSSSIYYSIAGYDERSGISGLKIKETIYKQTNGESASGTEYSNGFGSGKFEKAGEESGNEIYGFSDTYSFKTLGDGVIKLEFTLVDNAGNESTESAKTVYCIKDTAIDVSAVKFKEFEKLYSDSEYTPKVYRTSVNGIDTVTLTPSDNIGETLYGEFSTQYDIKIFWGNSSDTATEEISKNTDGAFVFSRNAYSMTYLKIIATDEIGNSRNIIRLLPPEPRFPQIDGKTFNDSKLTIEPLNWSQLESTAASSGASGIGVCCIEKTTSTSEKTFEDISKDSNGKLKTSGGTYSNVWVANRIEYDGQYFYSSASTQWYESSCEVVEGGFFEYTTTAWIKPTLSENTSLESYINDTVKLTKTGSKVIVNDYKRGNSNDLTYMFTYKECTKKSDYSEEEYSSATVDDHPEYFDFTDIATTSEPEYEFNSAKYDIRLYIKVQSGTEFFEKPVRLLQNGSSTAVSTFNITGDDVNFPEFLNEAGNTTSNNDENYEILSPMEWYLKVLPYKTPEGTTTLQYCILPNAGTKTTSDVQYTIEELSGKLVEYEGYNENRSDYINNGYKLPISIADIDEGLYTICFVATNEVGNYRIKCYPLFKRMLGRGFYEYYYSGSTIYLRDMETYDENYEQDAHSDDEIKAYLYKLTSSGWKSAGRRREMLPDDTYRAYNEFYVDSDTTWVKYGGYYTAEDKGYATTEAGFYDVVYKYVSSSEVTCERANASVGLNGLSIECDKSALVHIMYSSKKLSEGTDDRDIQKWLNLGTDLNPVSSDTNFTYKKSNYNAVPKGNWYVTVIHFADGTTVMTEPQQK